MTFISAEVIFNDTPSRRNKDLTNFLRDNLEQIILKAQLKFQFRIVRSRDHSDIRQRGIKKLPAMVIKGQCIEGCPDIIAQIRHMIKNSKSIAKPKTTEEILDDHYREALGGFRRDSDGKFVIEDQEEVYDSNNTNLVAKAAEEAEKRGLAYGQKSSNKSADRLRREQPARPSRNIERDLGHYEEIDAGPRHNNLSQNLSMEENPLESLARVRQRANPQQQRDDDLMHSLISRIGSGDDFIP
jgi:hypothetical protein